MSKLFTINPKKLSFSEGEMLEMVVLSSSASALEEYLVYGKPNIDLQGVHWSDFTLQMDGPGFNFDSDGNANKGIMINVDTLDEGSETWTVSIVEQTSRELLSNVVSVTVNDKPGTDKPTPKYTLSSSTNSAEEGSEVTFEILTENISPGTTFSYSIEGVSPSDIVGEIIAGNISVSSNNNASVTVGIASDQLMEDNEVLVFNIGMLGWPSYLDFDGNPQSISVVIEDVLNGNSTPDNLGVPDSDASVITTQDALNGNSTPDNLGVPDSDASVITTQDALNGNSTPDNLGFQTLMLQIIIAPKRLKIRSQPRRVSQM